MTLDNLERSLRAMLHDTQQHACVFEAHCMETKEHNIILSAAKT